MLVVIYNKLLESHGCWGEREVNKKLAWDEFKNMDHWLAHRAINEVEFIQAYEVTKRIDSTGTQEF